jgi:hypothetical protein
MSTRPLTLIIFELLQPYGKEIATVLALPKGFKLRFRFKRKWFATDSPLQIANTDGLVALRITRTAEILPLRFCRVTDVKDIGDIYYIVVEVGAFVELPSAGESQKEQLNRFNRDFRDTSLSGIDNVPGKGMEKLILIGPRYEEYFANPLYVGTEENRGLAAWGTLVEILIKQQEFNGLDFLSIIDFEGAGDRSWQPVENGEFILKPDQHYKLRVMQRRSAIEPVKDISLKLDGAALKPLVDRQVAVGAYDILEFSFRTADSQSSPQKSALVLTASGSDSAHSFTPIILPVIIPARSWILPSLASVLFVCSAITLIAPELVAGVFKQDRTIISEEVRSICIIAAILTSKQVGALASLIVNKTFHLGK